MWRVSEADNTVHAGLIVSVAGSLWAWLTFRKIAALEAGEVDIVELWVGAADVYQRFGTSGLKVMFAGIILLGVGLTVKGLLSR